MLASGSNLISFGGPIFLDDVAFKVNDEVVWTPYSKETLPDNQYWVDCSGYPYKTYLSTGDQFNEASNLVWVGNATMTNGKITNLFTNPYNYNGIGRILNEAWQRETSGFKTFWEFDQYSKRIREWCEQWGRVRNNANVSNTVTFLKPYKDTNYYVTRSSSIGIYATATYAKHSVDVDNLTTTSFEAYTYRANGLNNFIWFAMGYIN